MPLCLQLSVTAADSFQQAGALAPRGRSILVEGKELCGPIPGSKMSLSARDTWEVATMRTWLFVGFVVALGSLRLAALLLEEDEVDEALELIAAIRQFMPDRYEMWVLLGESPLQAAEVRRSERGFGNGRDGSSPRAPFDTHAGGQPRGARRARAGGCTRRAIAFGEPRSIRSARAFDRASIPGTVKPEARFSSRKRVNK